MDIALLLIRVTVGGILAAHGAEKLVGAFGGPGISGAADFLESVGFRPGRRYVWLLGLTEITSGLVLALGLLTPLAASAVAGVMIAAIATVHRTNGFFVLDGGVEYPLVLGVVAVAVAFAGAGEHSLDHLIGWSSGRGVGAHGDRVGRARQRCGPREPQSAASALARSPGRSRVRATPTWGTGPPWAPTTPSGSRSRPKGASPPPAWVTPRS